jgi:predicted nuclease of predicted toxin-antitoxin system
MGIKFFVDNNLGLNLVTGLRDLGYTNIEHLQERFKEDTIDEMWLKYVGENGLILITKDKKIRKNPKEKHALIRYKIIAYYLGGSRVGIRETSKQIINAWQKMELTAKKAKKRGTAAAFIVRLGGGKIIKEIPLS